MHTTLDTGGAPGRDALVYERRAGEPVGVESTAGETRQRVARVERDPAQLPGRMAGAEERPRTRGVERDPADQGRMYPKDNARVVLTADAGYTRREILRVPETGERIVAMHLHDAENKDASDRAHLQRDAGGNLLPAANSDGDPVRGKPRRYPASQVNVRGYAVDSQADWLHNAQQELAAEGITDLAPRRGRTIAQTLREGRADIRLRDLLERRTDQRITREERQLERKGSSLLRAARERR